MEDELFSNAKECASEKFLKTLLEIESAILNNEHKKEYSRHKECIETSDNSREVYNSTLAIYDFIEKNNIDGIKIDLFDDEAELTIKGCLHFCNLILDECSEPEDIFKINYALKTLSSPELIGNKDAQVLSSKLIEKKKDLIAVYDKWCIGNLEMNIPEPSPIFSGQLENARNVICKYNENKITIETFNPKDDFIVDKYNEIQSRLETWIKENTKNLVSSVPSDSRIIDNVSKLLSSVKQIKEVSESLDSLQKNRYGKIKQKQRRNRKRGFLAFVIFIGILGIVVGLSILLINVMGV